MGVLAELVFTLSQVTDPQKASLDQILSKDFGSLILRDSLHCHQHPFNTHLLQL